MGVQDDIGYLLTVAQESDADTSKIEEHLQAAKDADANGNTNVARDHMKRVLTGGEGFNADSPVGVLNKDAQNTARNVYDELASR